MFCFENIFNFDIKFSDPDTPVTTPATTPATRSAGPSSGASVGPRRRGPNAPRADPDTPREDPDAIEVLDEPEPAPQEAREVTRKTPVSSR